MARSRDPFPKLKKHLLNNDFSEDDLKKIEIKADLVKKDYKKALKSEDPTPEDLYTHQFVLLLLQKKQEKGNLVIKNLLLW